MSSRDVTQHFAALDGARIPGGCSGCDAYQDVSIVDGVTSITISHDAQCPVLARHEQRKHR